MAWEAVWALVSQMKMEFNSRYWEFKNEISKLPMKNSEELQWIVSMLED